MLDKNKIVIGMSGGVDSSVAATLLKEQGFEVIGVSMNLYSCDQPLGKGCCTPADRLDARKICERLNIPYEVLDLRPQFKEAVIDYFAREYVQGRTPLPCAPCNRRVRFKSLIDTTDAHGAYWIATGHYSRVEADASGKNYLLRGKDPKKDQSYFLFGLESDVLSRLKLPIGNFTKTEVRQLAKVWNLPVYDKPDSQELCFLSGEDHSHFIHEHFPALPMAAGEFVDEQGKVLGRHRGLPAYTIGQRRGLELSFGERRYVVGLDAEKNQVKIGNKTSLVARGLVATGVQRFDHDNVQVKIRSTHPGVAATLRWDDEQVTVDFEQPQMAVTPGQAAVFYQGDRLLGGGWIREALC